MAVLPYHSGVGIDCLLVLESCLGRFQRNGVSPTGVMVRLSAGRLVNRRCWRSGSGREDGMGGRCGYCGL